MVSTHLLVECELDGGLIILDEATVALLDDNLCYELTVALDPDGQSDIRHDFSGQDWATAWKNHTRQVLGLVNAGAFAVCILHSGAFHCEVTLLSSQEAPRRSFPSTQSSLSITSGKCRFYELGKLVEGFYSGRRIPPPLWTVELPQGDYIVQFSKADSPTEVDGEFGTLDSPALYVDVAQGQGRLALNELLRMQFS